MAIGPCRPVALSLNPLILPYKHNMKELSKDFILLFIIAVLATYRSRRTKSIFFLAYVIRVCGWFSNSAPL